MSSCTSGTGPLVFSVVPDTGPRVGGKRWMALTWHRVSVGLRRAGRKGWPGEVQWGGGRVDLAGWSPLGQNRGEHRGAARAMAPALGLFLLVLSSLFPTPQHSPCLSPLLSIFPGMRLSHSLTAGTHDCIWLNLQGLAHPRWSPDRGLGFRGV